MLMDTQLDLAADLERRSNEHVERVVDRPFRRVLDRHDAEIGVTGLHFLEDLADRSERQCAHGMAEMLEHRLLRERAFGSEECHLERLLLRQARRHDLAEQAHDLFVLERPLVALDHLTQHLRFALGPIELGGALRLLLGDADLLGQPGALVQELVDTFVDAVDARANRIELGAGSA